MMTKTQQLLAAIAAGTHRITMYGYVYRLTSTGEWVTDSKWRKDVVMRAQVALMKAYG